MQPTRIANQVVYSNFLKKKKKIDTLLLFLGGKKCSHSKHSNVACEYG